MLPKDIKMCKKRRKRKPSYYFYLNDKCSEAANTNSAKEIVLKKSQSKGPDMRVRFRSTESGKYGSVKSQGSSPEARKNNKSGTVF